MNYCDKIQYKIYTTPRTDFPQMVDSLLEQLSREEQFLRLIFFGMPADNEQYVYRRRILQEKVQALVGEKMPVVSYVSQPPLGSGLIMEAHTYRAEAGDNLSYKQYEKFPYVTLESGEGRFLFAGGFHGDVMHEEIGRQADKVFNLLKGLMRMEGFPVDSIVRQWNYVEQITGYDGADQHYQLLNNTRAVFYQLAGENGWQDGYPAATGIGTNLGGILVDADVFVPTCTACRVTPIDNRLQIAAHAYSTGVLHEAGQQKATPKFERAKSLDMENRRLVYISGTAAIRGEDSLTGVGLAQQTKITMENIAELTGDARLCMLRVYLKNPSFYEEAVALLEGYHLDIPISYMCADVCRDELLIEIEGVAVK